MATYDPSPGIRISRRYGFVRARQLEGTFPGSPATGIWPVSAHRVDKGWGYVLESEWPEGSSLSVWPPLEPPGLDQRAKLRRVAFHQRSVTLADCHAVIDRGLPVMASFEITKDWESPPGGAIPIPQKGEVITSSHAINLIRYDDANRRFRFINWWGPSWGDGGFGTLPYEYLDQRIIDAHTMRPDRPELNTDARQGVLELMWGCGSLVGGGIFHAREIYDKTNDDLIGWTHAVERVDRLNVEELFVKPQYRHHGHGRHLVRMLKDLSESKRRPLHFWITFADIDPENLSGVVKILRRIKYRVVASGQRWAAYEGIAGDRKSSFEIPPPPKYVPLRPASTNPIKTVGIPIIIASSILADAAAVLDWRVPSSSSYTGQLEYARPAVAGNPNESAISENAAESTDLAIGSAEYDRINERRSELIRREIEVGLSAVEDAELDRLQERILAVTKAAFPYHRIERDAWVRSKEEAGGSTESPD
jgi:GNAT superfamily N-acetyltransferase